MRNDKSYPRRAIGCYTGIAPCGCVVAVQVDDPADRHPKELIGFMRECVESGLTVGRSTVGEIRDGAFGHKCGVSQAASVAEVMPYELAGLKLWRAKCEIEVMIAAVDEPSEWDIKTAASEEASESDAIDHCRVTLITKREEIPERWIGSIPRGLSEDNPSDLFCEQIIEQRIAEVDAAVQAKLLAQPMPNQKPLEFAE